MPKQKKEKPPKPKYNVFQNIGFMLKLAWTEKEKKVPILCTVQAVLGVISGLVGVYLSPAILAQVEQHAPFSRLIGVILFFIGMTMLLNALTSYIGSNQIYGKITLRTILNYFVSHKATTTSYPNLGDKEFNRLHTRAMVALQSNNAAGEAIWGTLQNFLQNILGFAVYLALLSTLQPWIALVVVLTALAGFSAHRWANGYSFRHRDEVAEHEQKIWYISDKSRESVAAKDIRIFGLRDWLEELLEKTMRAYIGFQKRVENMNLLANLADVVLVFLRNGIVYIFLFHAVIHDGMTASAFLLYFSVMGNFAGRVNGIFNTINNLRQQSLDLSTMREYLDYPEPFLLEEGKPLSPDPAAEYELRLRDVSFRYPEAEEDTLSHIDLTIRSGEKLAVVGLNGAGKTTLVKLLCGFYDPTEGQVLLNGEDIRQYNRQDYYGLFAAVFQSFSLLADTVATNVTQLETGYDESRMKECVAEAGLDEKINTFPDRYDTLLDRSVYPEAVMLSGGETQRLMLARALYKNAPVLILDEPTAALDPIAEADMYQKYDEMTAGRTAIYISHRLASTRFCDRILLLENHRIAEEGTHAELLKKGGSYARLFEVQSKYYREGGAEDGEG